MNLPEAIKYLDSLDFVPGDSPCLHISWYRSGNNRRKVMQKNGSPFLVVRCSVAIARYDEPPQYNMEFDHFTAESEDPEEALNNVMEQVKEYVRLQRTTGKTRKTKKDKE